MNVKEVKIEYKTTEEQNPVRITDLQMDIAEIDENPLNLVHDSWTINLNEQTIDTKGFIKLYEVECSTSQLPVIQSPDASPTWGQWEEWEHCSGSCGFGTRSRFRKCIGGTDNFYYCIDEATETCEITCENEQIQVIDDNTSKEFPETINQTALNCIDFSIEVVFTFHNGKAKCSDIGPGWKYPPSTFYDDMIVDVNIEEFWIGARLNDNEWVDDHNEEIDEPVYDLDGSKILLEMTDNVIGPDGLPDPDRPDICLYWKSGNVFSGLCSETKPVVCCEIPSIAMNQGKD